MCVEGEEIDLNYSVIIVVKNTNNKYLFILFIVLFYLQSLSRQLATKKLRKSTSKQSKYNIISNFPPSASSDHSLVIISPRN